MIWTKLRSAVTVEKLGYNSKLGYNPSQYVFLDILFSPFRIFGFLDDTDFRTTRPGTAITREYRVFDNIQGAFYSGYFANHVLKAQVVSLPNGMVSSIFLASLRNSDSCILNMSSLNDYLQF